MSKLIGLILILGVLGGGAYYTGTLAVPEFGVLDRGDWTDVSEDRIEITSTAWLNNENPLNLQLNTFKANYRLMMNRVRLAEGVKKGLEIEEGNQTIEVKTDLLQKKIPLWWVKHIRNGEKTNMKIVTDLRLDIFSFPLTVRGISYSDSLETNLMETLDSSVKEIEGSYRAEIAPSLIPQDSQPEIEIRSGSAEWGKVNRENTKINFQFEIHNPNSYPVPTPELAGDVTMNKVKLIEWNANDIETVQSGDEVLLEAGETRKIDFKVEMDNRKIDDWLTSHVEKNEKTEATTTMKLVFDFEEFSLEVPQGEGIKCDFNFQTAILVEDQKPETEFQDCSAPAGNFDTSQKSSDGSNENDNTAERNSSSNTIDEVTEGITG